MESFHFLLSKLHYQMPPLIPHAVLPFQIVFIRYSQYTRENSFYVTEDYIVTKYYYSMIEKSNQIEEAIFELVPHTPMALCVLSFLFKNHCLEVSRKESVEGYDLKSCRVWSRSIYFTVCLSGCVLQPDIF